jgi:Triphosphoribosyl-dephospho-CoA synthetase
MERKPESESESESNTNSKPEPQGLHREATILMRSVPANAELALLLEVASTPTPGNVDRHHDHPDLTFEQFLAGAVGTRDGFKRAADGAPLGAAFERAIIGMSDQRGGNTQFGAVLAVTPLAAAAGRADLDLDRSGVRSVINGTTVDDTVAFYRAFDHVEVAVGAPPESLDDLDVRRGSQATPVIREEGLTLAALFAASTETDALAREWDQRFSAGVRGRS